LNPVHYHNTVEEIGIYDPENWQAIQPPGSLFAQNRVINYAEEGTG
jgi:hypothetical protein